MLSGVPVLSYVFSLSEILLMFDEYEKQKWERIKDMRSQACLLLGQLDDALTHAYLESDRWLKAYSILRKLVEKFGDLEKTVLVVRCRRLDPGGCGGKPNKAM